MDIHHIMNGTRIMADIVFNHREGRHPLPPTVEHPSQWRYVATRLTANMGASTPDDLNRLHWRWHHRAALRIRKASIRHNIWTIRNPIPRGPRTPDKGTEHQRHRSLMTQGPTRQVPRTSHSHSPHKRPPDVAPPCGPQRSPLWSLTHPWPDHGDQPAPDRAAEQDSAAGVQEVGEQPTPEPHTALSSATGDLPC